jgi:hypothetical protein
MPQSQLEFHSTEPATDVGVVHVFLLPAQNMRTALPRHNSNNSASTTLGYFGGTTTSIVKSLSPPMQVHANPDLYTVTFADGPKMGLSFEAGALHDRVVVSEVDGQAAALGVKVGSVC